MADFQNYGDPDDDWDRDDAPRGGEECPKCKGHTLQHGFGLSGGGYGPYTFCEADGCDYFDKVQCDI